MLPVTLTIGCEAGFEEELEIFDRPGRQPVGVRRDVRHKAAFAFRVWAAGKPRRGADAAQAVAAAPPPGPSKQRLFISTPRPTH
jgi:hypothetical protein